MLKQQEHKIKKRKIRKNKYDSDESTTDSDATDVEYNENEILNTHETTVKEKILELSQETITDDVQGGNDIVGWYYCGHVLYLLF